MPPARQDSSTLWSLTQERNPELSYPFEKWYRRDAARMKHAKFFEQHYFGPDEDGLSQRWRQIDTAWLETAEEVALALNDFTNNTSLALVFEFIDSGEVLLFPATHKLAVGSRGTISFGK